MIFWSRFSWNTFREQFLNLIDFRNKFQNLKTYSKVNFHKREQEGRGISACQEAQESSGLYRLIKKAGRFYLVGASGLLVNYGSSVHIGNELLNMYYLHATVLGIGLSVLSNFLLNKLWTFDDKDFSFLKVSQQLFWFTLSSIVGITVQISLVYCFVEILRFEYIVSLGLAVLGASTVNFMAAKILAFKEHLMT